MAIARNVVVGADRIAGTGEGAPPPELLLLGIPSAVHAESLLEEKRAITGSLSEGVL
jgi:hypothetical protein